MGRGARRLLCTPEAAGLEHFGHEACGHDCGSVLALYSNDLLPFVQGLLLVVPTAVGGFCMFAIVSPIQC